MDQPVATIIIGDEPRILRIMSPARSSLVIVVGENGALVAISGILICFLRASAGRFSLAEGCSAPVDDCQPVHT